MKSKFIENYHTMHPLYAQEKYALISGIDLTTQVFEVSRNFLMTDPMNEKEPKFTRELNNTKFDLLEVKAKEDSFISMN